MTTVVCVGAICFATLYYLAALACVRAFFARKQNVPEVWAPPVSVLKPVKGLDIETEENFASFLHQDYPDYQILFGVESKADTALPVIERLIQACPDRDIQLIVVGPLKAANHKVGILAALARRARYGLLVISDSDIRVPSTYLKEVMCPFQDLTVGMVTCLYRAARAGSPAGVLESLMIHLDFFPAVLVAEQLEGLRFGLGATMAVRRSALSAIGGFESLRDYIADDYQLGYLMHQAGYRVALSRRIVDTIMQEFRMTELLQHQLRWARTYRICRPKGYFASLLTQGVFLSTVYLLVSRFSPLGWMLFLITVCVRLSTAAVILDRYLEQPGWLKAMLFLPVKEFLSVALWIVAFCGNRITWRGKTFELQKDGQMLSAGRSPR